MATRHLIELGHRRIAFLGDDYPNPFNFTSSHDRYTGYKEALEDAGIPARPEYYVTGEHSRTVARELALQIFDLPTPPTAIFAASDTQAMGILAAARQRDIAVPEDLSVIGYDDIEIAEYLNLSTIRQPLFESGWRGIHLLFHIIDNGNRKENLHCDELPIELVKRGTTAPSS